MTELLVLGGERVAAAEGATADVIEPSTGTPAWEVAQASPEDARRAVDVAVDAFETGPWRRMSARERGHVLTKASFLIRDRQEELARLEARNGGKPIGGARAEIDIVANTYEYWGGAANKIFGETIPVVPPGLDVTLREPVGPCVLISPWNFPAVIANWKVAPALACGNTAVLKPASQTPLTALAIADLLFEAGLPEGTLSVLPGPGSTTAAALIADPRVAKIGFTGSTEVGKQVMEAAAANITRVSLELGGKSANVVFEDADLDVAIPKSLVVGLRQRGAGLLRALAPVRAAPDLRRVRRTLLEGDRRDPARRPSRRGNRDGTVDQPGAATDLARLPRDRAG